MDLRPLIPPVAGARRETPRTSLARLASAAVQGVPGITGLDARHATFAGTSRVPGVVAMADGVPGRFSLSLYLHARPTDLQALSEQARSAVMAAAGRADLAASVGTVHVTFTDLTLDPEGAHA